MSGIKQPLRGGMSRRVGEGGHRMAPQHGAAARGVQKRVRPL